ncbi:Taurine catabolism dioxygenase TauD, TfdA family [Nocardioides exalbidus]|uniref:Taurine catabolism dioxygenase TauD, TfdA family n=1 Tax=Nocardioides exalbidus TaxID=402596 RepID=A0A1H4PIY4_9ACTN|nr:TauD/TfdA family dioxygenase [Nocardioides exalbidus]SEC07042.1 Taurine catabolism dioxygenase TauD, TfdA family [Nocardioides exalbidus]
MPTILSTTAYWKLAEGTRDDLAHGLFTIDDGVSRVLAPAYANARFRFDPGCMTPADSRARRVVDFFVDALASATEFEWSEPNQVLVINNRTVLHARADAQADPDRQMQRLMFRFEKGTTL